MAAGKILVTGATGQLGRLIVKHLLRKLPAGSVVAGGRNAAKAPAGVDFRKLDYGAPDSIEAALAGITRVVLVSGSEVGKRVAQHRTVADAATRAGVELLAYTSILKADTNPFLLATEHRETEKVLAAGKLPYILLRNGWYSENYVGAAAMAVQFGTIQTAAGNARFSTAPRDDYAAGAAALILRDDHKPGQAYELAGSSSFTKQQLADIVSRKSGKKIVVENLTESAYVAALLQAGLPEPLAKILADSDAKSADGWLFDDSRTLEGAIGRPTVPLEQTLEAALSTHH
ncbi:MAG: SDR family oxidoreductase [Pseudomonadota bacterium]